MIGWPRISVVVPVLDADGTVRRCIQALLTQRYPGGYEILVVDNGSSDGTLAMLAEYQGRIRVLTEPVRGAGAARNTGVRRARHSLVAFTDADCVPDPQWLIELVSRARACHGADFVGGRIGVYEPSSSLERFTEQIFDQQHAIEGSHPPYAITANLLASRSHLLDLGLFDDREESLVGEDVDLSYRGFLFHGSRFAFAERAVVRHEGITSYAGLFAKGYQHGRAAAYVCARYRDHLDLSWGRRCVDPRRYTRVLAALARSLVRRAERVLGGRWSDTDVVHPLCDAVFNAGKQIGFVISGLRRRGRRSPVFVTPPSPTQGLGGSTSTAPSLSARGSPSDQPVRTS
ncbi:MAG: glycosyltransferase [Gemmatimonadota bacterium]|nr:MAG: glycosyltransferase [Gemmatimonadota bacterium]